MAHPTEDSKIEIMVSMRESEDNLNSTSELGFIEMVYEIRWNREK